MPLLHSLHLFVMSVFASFLDVGIAKVFGGELRIVSLGDTILYGGIRRSRALHGVRRMAKHAQTLEAIFAEPTRANIDWKSIEAMLTHFGADVSEGRGSRVRVSLNGVRAVFHRPHPQKEAGKCMVESVRRFLSNAGVTP